LSFSPGSLSFSHTLLEVVPLLPRMTTDRKVERSAINAIRRREGDSGDVDCR
jgi:hypothetical protein